MRRIRRILDRMLANARPGLLLVGVVCVAGLALHAADDWHHHGEMSTGFFHLHFHVGDHYHPDLEGPDAGHEAAGDGPADGDTGVHHSDDEIPNDGHPAPADSDRKRHAVLTVPHAVKQLSHEAPTVAAVTASPEVAVSSEILLPQACRQSRIADPRGPPA